MILGLVSSFDLVYLLLLYFIADSYRFPKGAIKEYSKGIARSILTFINFLNFQGPGKRANSPLAVP